MLEETRFSGAAVLVDNRIGLLLGRFGAHRAIGHPQAVVRLRAALDLVVELLIQTRS